MEHEDDPNNSFGIRRVVDCKLEGGQQMYKVEWQATWEPAETLATCQHLIDEFWSHINNVKAIEHVAVVHSKRMKLNSSSRSKGNLSQDLERLTDDNKSNIQQLIQRTNSTSAGNPYLSSPSHLLESQQPQQQTVSGMNSCSKVEQDTKPQTIDPGIASNKIVKAGNTDGMKYIENFSNPYVKLVVVCKICSKEQLPKQSYWRQHFLTHSDTKAHQCQYCSKSFSRPVLLRKHIESKHGDMASGATGLKEEYMNMKEEYMY